jgi:hypothetical protein
MNTRDTSIFNDSNVAQTPVFPSWQAYRTDLTPYTMSSSQYNVIYMQKRYCKTPCLSVRYACHEGKTGVCATFESLKIDVSRVIFCLQDLNRLWFCRIHVIIHYQTCSCTSHKLGLCQTMGKTQNREKILFRMGLAMDVKC